MALTLIQAQMKAVYAWNGYHNAQGFTRTNTAYGNPSTNASSTLTEVLNENFGSVVIYNSGGILPGITFSAPVIGKYFICVRFQGFTDTSTYAAYRLWDGTTQIDETETFGIVGSTGLVLQGVYNCTDTNSRSIRIECKAPSTKAASIGSGLTATQLISWTIVKL